MEIPKAYESKHYEDDIYSREQSSGFFSPEVSPPWINNPNDPDRPYFSMALPPPNVTGVLHMGHAAMLAIEDLLVRYHRMKGDRTLWLPGTDHAAIATQTKVEKILMEKGMKDPKKELGREKFLSEIERFARQSHDTIINQCKKIGSSLDWGREAFTLDEKRSFAVKTVFKKMYDDGLIERGYRIVNWCPRCHSTLADDEVEHKEQSAKIYTFKYSSDFPLAIATTRPETKLGDTGVAVNPKDKRYKKYIGKTFAVKSFAGGADLLIKIIGDETVDMNFGTGAVGVTPAHSFADYEMAQKNDLLIIKIIDEDGKMTSEAGHAYDGLSTKEARKKVVEYLRANNLLEKEEDAPNSLSVCYRCGAVIEPIPSRQWFIRVEKEFKMGPSKIKGIKKGKKTTLKKLMQAAVREGQIKIIPDRFEKTYFNWVDNLRDWCISRQIWYGHRIPVWYKGDEIYVGVEAPLDSNLLKEFPPLSDDQFDERTRRSIAILKKIAIKAFEMKWKYVVLSGYAIDAHLGYVSRNHKDIDLLVDKNDIQSVRLFLEKEGHAVFESKKYGKDLLRVDPLNEETTQAAHCDIHISYIDEQLGCIVVPMLGKEMQFKGNYESITENKEFLGVNIKALRADLLIDEKKGWEEKIGLSGRDERNNSEIIKIKQIIHQGSKWQQDPDTLDTWFSSGLWTFSTLGWPEDTSDFKNYHPTSVLETGYDILFFWVARMILMTTYTLGDIPFEKVYLHGLVRDEQGRKMSKSLGNVIDPLMMTEKYGADATRLSLVLGCAPGNDLKLSEEKIAGFRNFTNKLWNIARYILTNSNSQSVNSQKITAETIADAWILCRLDQVVKIVTENIEKFNFSYAGEQLRDFTWNELADWYLEIAKIEGNKSVILRYILENILKLWHPFMPFVTEAVWQEMKQKNLLIAEKWPEKTAGRSFDGFADFELIRSIITGVRSLRADYRIEPAKKLNVFIGAGKFFKILSGNAAIIKNLSRIEDLKITETVKKAKGCAGFLASGVEVYIDLSDIIDFDKERSRIEKEMADIKPYVSGLEVKLGNKEFIKNAPSEVVDKEREKLDEALEKLNKLATQLDAIK